MSLLSDTELLSVLVVIGILLLSSVRLIFGSDLNGSRAGVVSKPFLALPASVEAKWACMGEEEGIVAESALSFEAYLAPLYLKNLSGYALK